MISPCAAVLRSLTAPRWTANDVKYTFTRMLALPDSVQTDYASAIAGAEAVMDGTATDLEGIQVIDDTHFTVTLSDPFAGFLYELATASCSIMSEKNVEEAGDQFGMDCSKTIGSGPYVVTSWTRDSSIVLDANPNYWGEKPSVQHVGNFHRAGFFHHEHDVPER